MTLPPRPEPVEALKARAPAALARVFAGRDGVPFPGPGECRENVFDYPDGVRLIVSVERFDAGTVLHLSGSFAVAGRFFLAAADRPDPIGWALAEMPRRGCELTGADPAQFAGPVFPTPKKTPHWFVPWGER